MTHHRRTYTIAFWTGRSWLAYCTADDEAAADAKAQGLRMMRRHGEKALGHNINEIAIRAVDAWGHQRDHRYI